LNAQTLASWRDVALILLALEVSIGALILLGLSYFSVRAMRLVRAKVLEYLPIGLRYVQRTEHVTRRVSNVVVTPPTRIISSAHGIRTAIRTAFRGSADGNARV